MDKGSPGSVWVLHLRSAESDPGSVARTTPGTDHVDELKSHLFLVHFSA